MFLTRAHFCAIAGARSEDRAYLEAAAQILPPTYENWTSYKPLVRMAQIRFSQGRYDEAIALYQEVVEHVRPELRDDYSMLLAQMCRAVLQAAPHNTVARQCLSTLGEAP